MCVCPCGAHHGSVFSWNFKLKAVTLMTAIACPFLLGESRTLLDVVCACSEKIQCVHDALCGTHIIVSKNMWCIQRRMCHRRCMLREWAEVTQDERLHEWAQHCAGRCGAWDLISPAKATGQLITLRGIPEWWQGHWFSRNSEVDRSRFGYHDGSCPLRDDRNRLTAFSPYLCKSEVFDSKKREWLQKCSRRLQKLLFGTMSTKHLAQAALGIECMKAVLQDERWIPRLCQAQHLVDPWLIRPMQIECTRQSQESLVVRAVEDLLGELQALVEVISLTAVLGDLFSAKKPSRHTLSTLGTVTVPIVRVMATRDQAIYAQEDQGMEKETEQLVVLESLGGQSIILCSHFVS